MIILGLNLVKSFINLYWDSNLVGFLILLVYWITWIDFQVFNRCLFLAYTICHGRVWFSIISFFSEATCQIHHPTFQDNLLHEENSSEVIFTYLNKWAAFSPDEMTDRRWGAVPFVVVPLIFPVSLFRLNPWTNGYTKYCMVWFTKAAWARRFRIKSVCQHF